MGDMVNADARVRPPRSRSGGEQDGTGDRAADRTGPVGEPELRRLLVGLTAVRDGDFGTRLPGDGTALLGEIATVFNGMVDQLSLFTSEVTRVAREVGSDGRLGGQAVVPGVSGTWKDLTDSVNVMAGNLTTQVRSIAQVSTAVAKGDLSQRISVEAKGEVAALAEAINTMVGTLSAFADEVTRVAREVGTEGMLGGQARVPNVAGTWKDLTDNVNSMANNLTSQVRNIAQVTTAVARGDLTRKIDVDARGEILELKTTINTMVDQLSSFAAEVTRVAREVGSEGRLGGQAEVEGVSGTWKRLTENVNGLAGNLTRQVRAIAEVTGAVAEGDLTRSISVDASGEVADLKDNINSMVESLRETTRANQEQDWLKSNLARISGLMQGRRDLGVVAELIMDELTPLVAAQYGAFYLAEDTPEGTELQLICSYGYPSGTGSQDRPSRFRLGQSLVGQAARSRRTIAVDDVPAGYVISSGLGHTPPASLIVLPIVVENQVLGVIEIASVHRFTQIHRDFLDQLMETIGANVNTIVANARTDELLGESQRLAAELQARSGELQVRQEELQSSNAELEEKAALLATQNRDIETKNLEIEQARQELEERAQQLALASKYKSEFLANMSHELRTPLNSLLVLAQLLAQNPHHNLTSKQVEYAGVIHSAGSDLLQLINDILDLSKVEAGRMDVAPEWVPLRQLVDYVESTFRPLTTQKGLDFRVEVVPGAPTEVLTDDARLRQVLGNLMSNAVKFTEAGEVALRVFAATPAGLPPSARSQGPMLALEVRDTGIGIAEQQLEAIFGAFQQADGTTSRRYGGTGLGLSISREIAQLLGGTIQAASAPGEGSVFTFHLPVARPDFAALQGAATGGDAVAEPLVLSSPEPERERHQEQERQWNRNRAAGERESERRRLLVIEDQQRGLLSLVAESVVADLDHGRGPADPRGRVRLRSAAGAVEAAEALTTEPYDCVVLGLDANGEGGLRSLDAIMSDPALREVPVLVHPTRRLDPAQERLIAERARTRPLEVLAGLDELRERIARHLTSHRPREAAGGGANARGLEGRTILVIDDDTRNVFALTSMLELHGVRVLHAENGRKGIDALDLNPAVDLILMDVMMPEMDGYAATAAIRAMPEYADLPIIAVTAKAMHGDREKSLASGANDYVTKPVDSAALVACIRRWLR
ncbi:HAMP domain-containing protein [Streptomyces sp. H10-C2]|uniref:HAMP domain-containing protein n=1 Tax=unclassified Streptomyces TaxID=2593676 RepID=UPI0024BB9A38|nr:MULTISPECIES: HAMP domain-containing protein [unclassified Streptomyces]MDJ0343564.1 HAMP domain-containing protein [Streptomyces sp. PH10-H1]MDJ0368860.1 HAMP domain-containing protein [Streptomyces sp. H10-C2]